MTSTEPPDAWYSSRAEEPLDPTFLSLEDDEAAFFHQQTGIKDKDALQDHIIAVQREAFSVWPYPCIRHFGFTSLKISRLPPYSEVLQLGRERKHAVLLDLGCCFGNDARKAVADGFPAEQVIASDYQAEFWSLGYTLFRDSSESCGIRFVQGDIFSSSLIDPAATPSRTVSADPIATCVERGSLVPLQGHVSALHASAFFHLFDEAKQVEVAKRCAALLSKEPGSLIFGTHGGAASARAFEDRDAYAHSPESWATMWMKQVITDGSIAVEARLIPREQLLQHSAEIVKEPQGPAAPIPDEGWLEWVVRRI
ncbi:hypothetical protein EXIGLDRAFT_734645 [Exidia glandulosa HHB12029]|uniref:Methyltransferase domain-containing protein n=1 Tax=Exidia glandulosa HHB12029 TaxID=1314781 RepID=A0A165K4X7_EXIGL|nr:hypothetical protein EXIGLDRAFT_734645 [Exidia glandulosa HHB12029]